MDDAAADRTAVVVHAAVFARAASDDAMLHCATAADAHTSAFLGRGAKLDQAIAECGIGVHIHAAARTGARAVADHTMAQRDVAIDSSSAAAVSVRSVLQHQPVHHGWVGERLACRYEPVADILALNDSRVAVYILFAGGRVIAAKDVLAVNKGDSSRVGALCNKNCIPDSGCGECFLDG